MRLRLFALVLVAFLPLRAEAACTTGQQSCNTDTINNDVIVRAIRSPTVQLSVLYQYLAYCFANVWSEAASTAGNLLRVGYCNQIMAGGVDPQKLVAAVMNSTITGEILSPTCPAFPVGTLGTEAGCMVNVDVGNAIATLFGVTVSSASTTATAASGSTVLTVASATGVFPGQGVYGAGIPGGTVVQNVSGTSVAVSQPTTAALSTTPVLFTVSTGLP